VRLAQPQNGDEKTVFALKVLRKMDSKWNMEVAVVDYSDVACLQSSNSSKLSMFVHCLKPISYLLLNASHA